VLFPIAFYGDGVAQQVWVITTGGEVKLTVKYLFP
jgi:hypothetical protein